MPIAAALRLLAGPRASQAGAGIPLEHSLRLASKWAYTTRRISRERAQILITGGSRPQAGDLMLARVGHVEPGAALLLASGDSSTLFEGDLVVVVYGDRGAARCADDPEAAAALAPCHLVATGGIAACPSEQHPAPRTSTRLEPLGLVADHEGERLNLRVAALTARHSGQRPPVIAALDGSLHVGPAAGAAPLVSGFCAAGLSAGAARLVVPEQSPRDVSLREAGAYPVLDLTDAGICSAHRQDPARVERALNALVGHLHHAAVDLVVLDVGLGLAHAEAATLVRSSCFKALVDAVVLSAPDAASALVGVDWLQRHGFAVSAVTGAVAESPGDALEVGDESGARVLRTGQLGDPRVAAGIHAALGGAGGLRGAG